MNKKVLGFLQYLFFLGLGIFLLWLALRKSDWNTILNDLSDANYLFLVPATAMLMLSHFSRAVRWRILIRPLGHRPSLLNTFLAVMTGYLANLAVPRLGEVLKCTLLGRYDKMPADKLIGTIVAERAIDVCSLFIILLLTIAVQYELIGSFAIGLFKNFFFSGAKNFSGAGLTIIAVLVVFSILLCLWLLKKMSRLQSVGKFRKALQGIWQGLISIRYIENKGAFFFHTVLIWTLYLYSAYMGFFAMKDMSQYGIKAALSALTFGSFGMIVPSPGGIGSYQYAIQQVMLLYGVSPEKGLSLGMLIWFSQTAIFIIFGGIAFLLFPLVNKRRS